MTFQVRAIETKYAGCRFRSRLEARWAVFFDTLGVKWEYEPQGFHLASGRYLPDFLLTNVSLRADLRQGVWFEVKPTKPSLKEINLCEELGESTEKPVLVGTNIPKQQWGEEFIYQIFPSYDEPMLFLICENCNRIMIEYQSESYEECPYCGYPCLATDGRLLAAVKAARSARFEFGECGR